MPEISPCQEAQRHSERLKSCSDATLELRACLGGFWRVFPGETMRKNHGKSLHLMGKRLENPWENGD